MATLLFPVAAHASPPPYSNGHAYRHGAVPFRGHQHKTPTIGAATSANDLNYGGGISGVGVTTGSARVYLVFWGSQWGTQGTNSVGNVTFSGDSKGMAPDLQAFFKGIGTGGETWSGVMTQYCQGVAAGSQSCPSSSNHVGYPTGGALAGVWEDTSSVPSTASGHQIGVEAAKAATHFGNTSQSSNLSAQYVIVFPTGTNPDNYKTDGFCAWHDYTGDSTLDGGGAVSSSDGLLAFTNLPYIPDAGASCGRNFVNPGSAGRLDGVTIVEGHEYAETITDTYPAGGWTDSSGAENGDKCAWISSGQGKAQNIALSTGSFAVQSTWANDFNGGSGGCEVSHPIVTNGGNTVTVTNPGNQSSTVGTSVSVQMQASDSASGQTLSYSATGLPAGLSISSASGLISGTPTTAGSTSVTVTATDTTGAAGSTSFTWTVNSTTGNTVTVTNPGSQSSTVGTSVSLQIHASDSASGQTLSYSATSLPAGLSINSASGLISGTPTTAATSSVTVTAKDATGASGATSFTWTVSSATSCTARQLLGNPGFETGSASPWTSTAGVVNPNGAGESAHSGSWYAWLDGYGTPHTDTLAQAVSIPAGCTNYTFSFWLWIDSSERTSSAIDTLKVQVLNSSGTVLQTVASFSNLNANNQYVQHSYSLASYAGQTVTLKFTGVETDTGGGTTNFVIDDTALNVS
ncbi:MAG TPA: putative Ig domain-containing protein [Solirubrobacteraceae bacterium]|nr:putative Ig domain-containing protein [Solirubrobacteraceae bacterium]